MNKQCTAAWSIAMHWLRVDVHIDAEDLAQIYIAQEGNSGQGIYGCSIVRLLLLLPKHGGFENQGWGWRLQERRMTGLGEAADELEIKLNPAKSKS